MNDNIQIMIELQGYWQNVLREERNIERYKKSIAYWKDELRLKKDQVENLDSDIKTLKTEIKNNELALNELEEKLQKLKTRKQGLAKEKELMAIGHEINTVNEDRDSIEEKLIFSMDGLSEKEEELESLSVELSKNELQVASDTDAILANINESELIIENNMERYQELEPSLDSQYRSKFTKILKAKNGIAVCEVKDDVCSGCNFTIPPSLSIEASKSDTISICTNCGRFIYK